MSKNTRNQNVGGGSDWSTFPAIGNVEMSNYSISNLGGLNDSVNATTGYVLTVSANKSLTWAAAGGGTASAWSTFPATQTVNISGYSLSNVSNISLQKINGATYPQAVGTAGQILTVSSTANTLYWANGGGGNISNWATCNAVQNVNLSGYSILNVSNISTGTLNASSDVFIQGVSVSGSISNLSSAVTSLSGTVSNLSSAVTSLSGTVSNLSSAVTSLSGTVSNLSSAVTSLSGTVSNLSSAVSSLSGTVSNLSGYAHSISGAQFWSTFPAVSFVNISSNDIQNITSFDGTRVVFDNARSRFFIGSGAGLNISSGYSDINAFGYQAGSGASGSYINAFGVNAGSNSVGSFVNAIGPTAGRNNTQDYLNAIGPDAADGNTGYMVNCIGLYACGNNTGGYVNAIGQNAGASNSGVYVNAIGQNAGFSNTGSYVNAIGSNSAGSNTGSDVNAIGSNSAWSNTGSNVNAIGKGAGIGNSGLYVNAIGDSAGFSNTGSYVNAIGVNAGFSNTGSYVNAIGSNSAANNTGSYVNAIGSNSAGSNTGSNVNAIGEGAGYINSGSYVNAIGSNSAGSNTGGYVNAIGQNAGASNTGSYVNAIGEGAGYINSGSYVNAIGSNAGSNNTGSNCIFLGTNWCNQINASSDQLVIYSRNSTTNTLRADLSKNCLGINCNSPQYTLDVNGTANLSSAIVQNNLSLSKLNGASYPQTFGTSGQVLTVSSTANTLYWRRTPMATYGSNDPTSGTPNYGISGDVYFKISNVGGGVSGSLVTIFFA